MFRIDGALKDEAASKRQYKDAFNELRCLQDFLQSMIALPTAVATEIVTSQSNTSNVDRVSNAYKLEECQDADSGKVPNSRICVDHLRQAQLSRAIRKADLDTSRLKASIRKEMSHV